MTPQEWKTFENLFSAAMDLPEGERDCFLESTCPDPEVKRLVRELLSNAIQDGFLDSCALAGARNIIQSVRELELPSEDSAIGDQLLGKLVAERYEVLRVLGRGGHSTVFLAADLRVGNRNVVLKVLNQDADHQIWLRKRFHQEIEILGRINHPGVVAAHDCGQLATGQPFLVMDFVDGITLRERLRSPIDAAEIGRIVCEIGNALGAAHQLCILHRDLKPENIMLQSRVDPGQQSIKLIDFGIAKLHEPDGSATATFVVAGTQRYMAPEQFFGTVSAATDIFAFGVICYEMLTGSCPFEPAELARAIAAKSADGHNTLLPDTAQLPPAVRPLLSAALSIAPENRPNDVKPFSEQMAEVLRTGRSPRGTGSILFRRRVIVSLLLVAVLVCVGATLRMVWRSPPAQLPTITDLRRLTSEQDFAANPSIDADGKIVAYASDQSSDGHFDIWAERLGSTVRHRVTSDPSGASEPSLSSDGSKVVYRSNEGHGAIYVKSTFADTKWKIDETGRGPHFSPDGKWIAYSQGEEWSGRERILVAPAHGGTPRLLSRSCGLTAGAPVWSPDSKFLLYWCENFDGERRVDDWWTSTIDGARTVKTRAYESLLHAGLTPFLYQFSPSQWTARGVLFNARWKGDPSAWLVDISRANHLIGSPPERIRSELGSVFEASLSTLQPWTIILSKGSDNVDLYSAPLAANSGAVVGGLERLTLDPARDTWPSASRDGKKVAFLSKRSGQTSLWLKELPSGTERPLTPGIKVDIAPRISHDGSKIVFSVVHENVRSVYVVDTEITAAGHSRKLCDNCGLPHDWSSDGKFILADAIYGIDDPSTDQLGLNWIDGVTGGCQFVPTRKILIEARFSSDGKWLAFYIVNGDTRGDTRQVFIAPIRRRGSQFSISEDPRNWIAITAGRAIDRNPAWSPDGNLLYFQSERDGSRCIWARRLDPVTKVPVGPEFPVFHSHNPRLSLANAGHETAAGLCVTESRLIFSMGMRKGDLWVGHLQ